MCSKNNEIRVLQPSGYEIIGKKYCVNNRTIVKIIGEVETDGILRSISI